MLEDIYALISDESIYEPDLEDDYLTESLNYDLYRRLQKTREQESLRKFREELGITQKQLADFVGVSKATIGNWERNLHEPDFFYQKELSNIFKHPKKLKESITQWKCVICGGVLPLKAKKYCSAFCRKEGLAEWKKRYREMKAKAQAKDESAMLSFQLMLFDVSVFEKEKTKRRRARKRTQNSAKPKAESLQCKLW